MDELRSEIRAAFEREQAAHPPLAGLRRNFIQAMIVERRPAPNLQWLAIAAAVLLGVAVVVGLMATRLAYHGSVPAAPKATPAGDYGPPTAGVPLLYVHDPNQPTWLIGFDWTGKPRATVKINESVALPTDIATRGVSVMMAPDGQSFGIGLNAKGGTWQFLDRLGNPIASPSTLPGAYSTMWADDNQHVCSLTVDQQTFEYRLWTQLPGQAIKMVTVVARDSGIGQTGISLAACSFHNDVAIAVRTTTAWPSEYWVIRVSDGKVLNHYAYPSGEASIGNIVASGDGTLIAETSSRATGDPNSSAALKTLVRRVADRSVVGTLDPTMGVLAFDGDGSLVLVSISPMISGNSVQVAVVDVQSGQTVWQSAGMTSYPRTVAQPGGRDFAIGFTTSGVAPGPVPVWIVHADGTADQLPSLYDPTW